MQCLTLLFRIIKNAVRASGGALTKKHLTLVSEVAMEILDGSRKFEDKLGIAKTSTHTVRSFDNDVQNMVAVLLEEEVVTMKSDRKWIEWDFVDPRREGILKVENGWLQNYLQKKIAEETVESQKRTVDDVEEVQGL